jgi:hypothetical protein
VEHQRLTFVETNWFAVENTPELVRAPFLSISNRLSSPKTLDREVSLFFAANGRYRTPFNLQSSILQNQTVSSHVLNGIFFRLGSFFRESIHWRDSWRTKTKELV